MSLALVLNQVFLVAMHKNQRNREWDHRTENVVRIKRSASWHQNLVNEISSYFYWYSWAVKPMLDKNNSDEISRIWDEIEFMWQKG